MIPKCPHCPTRDGRIFGLLFAFKDGQIVYYCTRHNKSKYKDPITSWMRVPKLTWEDNDAIKR